MIRDSYRSDIDYDPVASIAMHLSLQNQKTSSNLFPAKWDAANGTLQRVGHTPNISQRGSPGSENGILRGSR